MKKNSKLLVVGLGFALTSALTACGGTHSGEGEYTYRSYSSALATNWNPCTWETNADSGVLSYLEEGLVNLEPSDTKNGIYQWTYDMATSITDITKTSADTLVKYGVFSTKEDATKYIDSCDDSNPGKYVYQVKLRDDLKWQNGDSINADSFIESMKLLLEPKAKNYRANLYVAGESAIAGGDSYYYQGSTVALDNNTNADKFVNSEEDIELKDGIYVVKSTNQKIHLALNASLQYLSGNTLKAYVDTYGDSLFDIETWNELIDLLEEDDDDGLVDLSSDVLTKFKTFLNNSAGWGEDETYWTEYIYVDNTYASFDFSNVGIYKEDDLTFCYVMKTPLEQSSAWVSFSETWLVHPETYESLLDKSKEPWTTTYGTSVETTMSYGPYKLTSLQADKQIVLETNENWHGYVKDGNSYKSTTNFKVDGEYLQQYQATKVIIDKLDDASAKQQFLAGNLTEYAPTASELSEYTLSDALYQVDETYTMSFFFNTKLDDLKKMDSTAGNQNSVVLSDTNFRKAMSLAINRAEFVTATPAYKPAYSIMNDLYYYDVWNDPNSSYRASEPAMQAICNLYGVKYGEGEAYATLEEAYKSINGYNLTEAKNLMKEACKALVNDGLYTEGAEIKIKIAYAKGAIQSDEQKQIALMNKFLNAAVEGSGFGNVTLEAVGNLADRYGAVGKGDYAIGYGAWGGAAFYPFRNFQVYCDPDSYNINESACWDPKVETLTIKFDYNGETFEDTLTWQAWSNALVGSGKYANASNEIKLRITAFMEEAFLGKYYRIPLASTTSAFLLGYQVSYITETYNIMYGFGGFRLMKFNYDDAQWTAYVKRNNGQINYK